MASAAVSWSLSDRKCGLFCAGKRRCHGAGAATSSSLFDRDDRRPSALVAPPARRRRQRERHPRTGRSACAVCVAARVALAHTHTHSGGRRCEPAHAHTPDVHWLATSELSHRGTHGLPALSATAQSTRSMTRATCCRRRCRRRWGCGGSSARVREPAEACSAWA